MSATAVAHPGVGDLTATHARTGSTLGPSKSHCDHSARVLWGRWNSAPAVTEWKPPRFARKSATRPRLREGQRAVDQVELLDRRSKSG